MSNLLKVFIPYSIGYFIGQTHHGIKPILITFAFLCIERLAIGLFSFLYGKGKGGEITNLNVSRK